MNDQQKQLTKKMFPILYTFACAYEKTNPDDIRQALRDNPVLLNGGAYWKTYEQALQVLSESDKEYILNRLESTSLGWPQFEQVLNEALAYSLLIQEGHTNLSFIKDNGKLGLQPDIKILSKDDSLTGLVEVKTIDFSQIEKKNVNEELKSGLGRFLSTDIHETLLKKITEQLNKAVAQLWSYNSSPLPIRRIYLFLHLDSGNQIDLILVPQDDLKEFLCSLIKKAKNGLLSANGKKAELRIYDLFGLPPVEIRCN